MFCRFLSLQIFPDILSGVGGFIRGNLLRRTAGDHGTALVAALRAHIDDIVCRLDHVQVVLDDHDRVPALCKAVQDLHQFVDIR